ncbi:hypothetical protein K9M43_01195, partial [Candidatus Gracilibacteria bacterium]|nr:hypothetical protein [Candidatus Gracilibacteria bacterium]
PFFQKVLPKFLRARLLETGRHDFENSIQSFEQVRQADGSILRRYKLKLTITNVAGLTYPLDLDPSTFVQTADESAEQAAEEVSDPTTAVTSIGRDLITNDLTVRGTLTTSGTNLSIDDDLLYLDSDNDRVGIGTTAPSSVLEVNANTTTATAIFAKAASSGVSIPFLVSADYQGRGFIIGQQGMTPSSFDVGGVQFNATTYGGILQALSNIGLGTIGDLVFQSAGGRVGIGNTAPTAQLHVKGSLSTALTGTLDTTDTSAIVTGTSTIFNTELAVDDAIKIGLETFTVASIESNTSLTLNSASTVTASGVTAYKDSNLFALDDREGINKVTVVRSGNVGIGTTAPNNLLEVQDLISFKDADLKTQIGYQAGRYDLGQYNTYIGYQAGYGNEVSSTVDADKNTAVGYQALYSLTTAIENSALGYYALTSTTTGISNAAVGYYALSSNTTGYENSALGERALTAVTTGYRNSAIGRAAGRTLTTGYNNVFIGYHAGYHASQKVDAVNSMALGNGTYTTADNQVVIGNTSITQTLLNGNVGIGIGMTAPTAALEVNGGVVFKKITADPCGAGYPEGVQFYNDTSDYFCFCDGSGVDKKVSDNGACF